MLGTALKHLMTLHRSGAWEENMKKSIIGALAVSTFLSPVAAMAETEVQFWHAFTGRLGELVQSPS